MTSKDSDLDNELLERYRRASAIESTAPSEAVRTAILAEARRAADERAKKMPEQAFELSVPAANDSRWKITALGTAGAALMAALLFAPRPWVHAPASSSPSTPSSVTEYGMRTEQSAPTAQKREASQGLEESVRTTAPSLAANAPAAPVAAAPFAAHTRSATRSAALQSAALAGDAMQAAELLNKGAPIDARDELGRTPLMLAVTQNRLAVVRLLLDRGADPNVADDSGRTPLQQARQEHSLEIAALLQKRGAR